MPKSIPAYVPVQNEQEVCEAREPELITLHIRTGLRERGPSLPTLLAQLANGATCDSPVFIEAAVKLRGSSIAQLREKLAVVEHKLRGTD